MKEFKHECFGYDDRFDAKFGHERMILEEPDGYRKDEIEWILRCVSPGLFKGPPRPKPRYVEKQLDLDLF